FAIDRSNSMADALTGGPPMPGEENRWQLLRDALAATLSPADLLEVGAKFFPRVLADDVHDPVQACMVDRGIDLPPTRGGSPALLSVFESTQPRGGTPTAFALGEVRDWLVTHPITGVPRFVILATDGGPNCNPDTGVPPDMCLCTGVP